MEKILLLKKRCEEYIWKENKQKKRFDNTCYTGEKSKEEKAKRKGKNKSIKVGGIHSHLCYFKVNLMLSINNNVLSRSTLRIW